MHIVVSTLDELRQFALAFNLTVDRNRSAVFAGADLICDVVASREAIDLVSLFKIVYVAEDGSTAVSGAYEAKAAISKDTRPLILSLITYFTFYVLVKILKIIREAGHIP